MLPAVLSLPPNPQPGFWYEPTRFEMLAFEVGISEDELRGLLRRLIAKKCGWATPRQL
jgi:hypothetical protein